MNTFQESNHQALANTAAISGSATVRSLRPAAGRREDPSLWSRVFGVAVDRSTWGAFLYMLVALGTGIAYFTFVITGFSLFAGLMVLIVGIPLFVLFLAALRGLSFLEGRLVEALLGAKIPEHPRPEPDDLTFLQRIWVWLKDGRTWTAMAYMLLQLPLGIFYFTVAVTGLAGGAWLIVVPFMQWIGGHTYIHYGSNATELLFQTWQLPLLFLAGCLVIVGWMHLIRAIGRGHARYAEAMLTSSSSLSETSE